MVANLKMSLRLDPEIDDRRVFVRAQDHFRAEARRLDHSLAARRQPRVMLDVRDVSLSGVSALTDQVVQEGERVTIFFPPRRQMPQWSAFGRVVRCEPSALGFRVAVEFDPLPAA
jgi:hypothetical protein